MEERLRRIPDEPDLSQPHCVVTVRHPVNGNMTRLFRDDCTFSQVYDWVGSTSTEPEYFCLLDYNTETVSPDEVVYSGIFNLNEKSEAIPLSPEGEVAFSGFATRNIKHTIINTDDLYEQGQEIRIKELDKLKELISVTVSRETVYPDMIALFSKRNVSTHKLSICFQGESAVGDGVTRDAFSEFFVKLQRKMDGCAEKVPTTDMDEEELNVVGSIITHAFIQLNIFPTEVCKASLNHYLFDSVSDNSLISSFLNFISIRESQVVKSLSEGQSCKIQPIIDILSEYGIFDQPSAGNINSLILKAAKSALIRLPCFSFQAITKGMGMVWKKFNPSLLDALYEVTVPSAEKLIECMAPNEVTSKDGKVTTWLHRYIRSCTEKQLKTFIRFVTGSPNLPYGTTVKVEYVDQTRDHLRPIVKTCFKILILARQYMSFTELTENLDFHTSNEANWNVHDNF